MVPESEIKAETHRSGHRVLDLVLGGSALFISLCSLGLAIHTGRAMDRLVEANSRPVLTFSNGNADPEDRRSSPRRMLYFQVENPGAGSARVEWVRLDVQGHEVGSWNEALKLIRASAEAGLPDDGTSPPAAQGDFVTSTVGRSYLRPGNTQIMFSWLKTDANAAFWDKVEAMRHHGNYFHLTACYCSIFDQCWVADSKTYSPKAVANCDAGRPKTITGL
jgi:hypothetical protein